MFARSALMRSLHVRHVRTPEASRRCGSRGVWERASFEPAHRVLVVGPAGVRVRARGACRMEDDAGQRSGPRRMPGQKVLVHAGAGGLGSTLIQLAKHLGAMVATTAG